MRPQGGGRPSSTPSWASPATPRAPGRSPCSGSAPTPTWASARTTGTPRSWRATSGSSASRPPDPSAASPTVPRVDDRPQRPQVEIVVATRTLVTLLAFVAVVALAIVSLGILLSIFVAIVLALGLDPLVAGLVRRGWRRGPAALAVVAALFIAVGLIVLVTVGPLWGQIKDFAAQLPAYWDKLSNGDVFQAIVSQDSQSDVHEALQDLAQGLPDAAGALLGAAGNLFGAVLSLVTLTFLALFMLMERPTITDW